ncbi:MAG: hypothetical protein GJT30_14125 [Geobacter sp.]|nr:hypothetical protein [Geobacter sp.]
MPEKHWIDYVTAVGAVATPLLVLLLTGIGWTIRRNQERQHDLEDKLREKRIEIYNQILEPFIILLTSDMAWQHDKQNKGKDKNDVALGKLLSLDYRRQAFKLALVGSDEVVQAYNDLMQFFFSQEENPQATEEHLKSMLSLLGSFLLQIRKSMGNETSKLTNWQMLEWFITDARKHAKS